MARSESINPVTHAMNLSAQRIRDARAASIRAGRRSAMALRAAGALSESPSQRQRQAHANSAVHNSGGGEQAQRARSDFKRGFGSIRRWPSGSPKGGQFKAKG